MDSAKPTVISRYLVRGALASAVIFAGIAGYWMRNRTEPGRTQESGVQSADSLFVVSRRLQNGQDCTVTLRAAGVASRPVESLDAVEVKIDGKPIDIPAEAFRDLRQVTGTDTQIAESDGDVMLLLGGGQGEQLWRCSLRVRGGRVVQREFMLAGASEPKVDHFLPPRLLLYGTIPPQELAKARLEQRQRAEAVNATPTPRTP